MAITYTKNGCDEGSVKKPESPSYLKTTVGNRYLARFEVVRSGVGHARIDWELTDQRDKAIVFCSEAGAGMIAVLFERYVRSSDAGNARYFTVLPVDLEFDGNL